MMTQIFSQSEISISVPNFPLHCALATKVNFSLFRYLPLILSFPIPKIKVWDKESPKLLLGQHACKHMFGENDGHKII